MPLSIGVNLRVTGHCNQGGRKYMEDMFSVAYQQTPDDKDLEYAFFGIFDGHGGDEAATFAKEHLMDIIVKQKNFWSDRDEDVLRAIRDGYVNTHYAMWRELDKWPRTASGLPSTAGTTASIAFIRKGKMYIGHVGDSGIILGHQVDGDPQWRAKALTKDHKPESGPEMMRIQESGGKVVSKSGVPRVVWNRPRIGHKGPVRRSTHIDEIPFLAVARSLGDLWSYNSELDTFVVSPEPDIKVVAVDVKSHRCLIFGTDGLWNMLTPQAAVAIVQSADRHNEKHLIASQQTGNGNTDVQMWINPSKSLVDKALERWFSTRLRADNTSVVTVMLDPPGPSRTEMLLNQKRERVLSPRSTVHHSAQPLATENIEKPIDIPTSCVPKPPPTADLTIDTKQPDSSNEINLNKEQALQLQNILPLESTPLQDIDALSDLNNTVLLPRVEEPSLRESIQVAEISSSDISEETPEIENRVNSKKPEILNKKETWSETCDNKEHESRSTPIHDQQISRIEECIESNSSNNISVCSTMQQNVIANSSEESKSVIHLSSRLRRNGSITESNSFGNTEIRNSLLSASQHSQHPLLPSVRDGIRATKRSHSLTSAQKSILDSGPSNSKPYMTLSSRLKLRNAKSSIVVTTVENTIENTVNRANNTTLGAKRRHSTIHQPVSNGIEESYLSQEPCIKRRTRSECQISNPTDENDPANQKVAEPNSRLGWPVNEFSVQRPAGGSTSVSVQERLSGSNTFQRRSLGKKATPVKTIRRPSINGSGRLQLRGSFGLRDWDQTRSNRSGSCNSSRRINRHINLLDTTDSTTISQRWLRSDTMAATPVKTLRSRNVDITGHTISAQLVHQYGVVKQNRVSLLTKLKQSASGALQSNRVRSSSMSSSKLKQASSNSPPTGTCTSITNASTGSSSGSGIAKRVKPSYNPSARTLSTRSLIKRLGKCNSM